MNLNMIPASLMPSYENMCKYAPQWLTDDVENEILEATDWEAARTAIDHSLTETIRVVSTIRDNLTKGN